LVAHSSPYIINLLPQLSSCRKRQTSFQALTVDCLQIIEAFLVMKVDGYSVQRSRFQRLDPEFIALRTRSAALQADPKAKELDHFLCSHSHEDRVRSAVGAATRMQSGNLSVSARMGLILLTKHRKSVVLKPICTI